MKKLWISVIIGIIVIIGISMLVMSQNTKQENKIIDIVNEGVTPIQEISPEIQEKLEKIKKTNLENEYTPKQREWITSGPFQIDRSEYLLGEKIFMRINNLQLNEKGQIIFLRPLNETHHTTYLNIPFDGIEKNSFNYYLEPTLSKSKKICSIEDILGNWVVTFHGTKYQNLSFEITNEIIPGEEDDYDEPVC